MGGSLDKGVKIIAIRDGLSNTVLVGEKHVPLGTFGQGWLDNSIYNGDSYFSSSRPGGSSAPLAQGLKENRWCFGSYHFSVCQFGFADGSVRPLFTTIDPTILGLYCDIADGQVIPE